MQLGEEYYNTLNEDMKHNLGTNKINIRKYIRISNRPARKHAITLHYKENIKTILLHMWILSNPPWKLIAWKNAAAESSKHTYHCSTLSSYNATISWIGEISHINTNLIFYFINTKIMWTTLKRIYYNNI